MTTILQLIFEFFKTGLFAVGGGLATLPFLYDIAEKTGWFTNQDILDLIAISESTPGAIGINMATYVGYLTEGVLGGIIATLALIAPSLVIIIIISKIMEQFKNSPVVQGVFKGLRPASTGLIVAAGLSVAELAFLNLEAWTGFTVTSLLAVVNWKAIVLAVAVYLGLIKFKKHPILYIALSAVVGIIFKF
ncbi:MAG: chromate transporter [Firmicutes bacterium]|nr:chromate transporter [Bacillota bacterium]